MHQLMHQHKYGRLLRVGLLALTSYSAMAGKMSGHDSVQWNNIYVGGQIGYGWSNSSWNFVNPNFFNTLGATILGTKFGFEQNGAVGGGFLGLNAQFQNIVLGVEGIISDVNIKVQKPSPTFPTLDIYSTHINWYSLVKGKIGIALNQFLLYGSGGWAGSKISLSMSSPAANVYSSASRRINGWTAGAGLEYRMNQNLSVGVVYDYIKLNANNETLTCPTCGVGVGLGTPVVNGDVTLKTLAVRASYLFNW